TFQIDPNVLLQSSGVITLGLASGGTFTNNGTLQAVSGIRSTTIHIDGPNDATGGILNYGGSGTVNPGSGNTFLISSTGSSSQVTLASNLNQTVSNGTTVIITPVLQGPGLGSTATIAASGTVTLNSGISGGSVEVKAGSGSSGKSTIALYGVS